MSDASSDPILGKIVIDFSRKYVSVYLCEGDGAIKDFDHFRWPYRLDTKETRIETRDCFDFVFDYYNDLVNPQLQGEDDGRGQSVDGGSP